ncbi:MAG: hypothetical protein ACU0DK_17505 [Pseudooceanicola sp.]
MKSDDELAAPETEARIEASLRKQLKAIEREEAPERLLVLARELQQLLREKHS